MPIPFYIIIWRENKMENGKKVLLFHVEKEKKEQIKSLCRELNIEVKEIDPSKYAETLGFLAEIKGIASNGKKYLKNDFSKGMLVFSGIHEELLDVFLQKYKEAKIDPIGLKAILTPINVFWNAQQLYEELEKEHEAMRS